MAGVGDAVWDALFGGMPDGNASHLPMKTEMSALEESVGGEGGGMQGGKDEVEAVVAAFMRPAFDEFGNQGGRRCP